MYNAQGMKWWGSKAGTSGLRFIRMFQKEPLDGSKRHVFSTDRLSESRGFLRKEGNLPSSEFLKLSAEIFACLVANGLLKKSTS